MNNKHKSRPRTVPCFSLDVIAILLERQSLTVSLWNHPNRNMSIHWSMGHRYCKVIVHWAVSCEMSYRRPYWSQAQWRWSGRQSPLSIAGHTWWQETVSHMNAWMRTHFALETRCYANPGDFSGGDRWCVLKASCMLHKSRWQDSNFLLGGWCPSWKWWNKHHPRGRRQCISL